MSDEAKADDDKADKTVLIRMWCPVTLWYLTFEIIYIYNILFFHQIFKPELEIQVQYTNWY